jgi:hypothetical protein
MYENGKLSTIKTILRRGILEIKENVGGGESN